MDCDILLLRNTKRKEKKMSVNVLQSFISGAIFGVLVGILIATLRTLAYDRSTPKVWGRELADNLIICVISSALILGSVWSLMNVLFYSLKSLK